MNKNVGTVDKVIRVIVAIALFSLLFVLQGNLKWLGLIGLVPFVTAFAGFCPLYSIVGIRTCAKN